MRTNVFILITGFILNVLTYLVLPGKIPVHFNIAGKPDRWGSKGEYIALSLAALFVIFILYIIIPEIDPKRRNLQGSRGYHIIFRIVLLLAVLISVIPYVYFRGISISKSIAVLMGLFFILVGNYLPTIKPNYFVGIRTPWTLENEEVWRKTHRIGGWTFAITGIVLIFSILLPEKYVTFFFIGLILILTAFLVLYSYIYWRKFVRKKS